MRKALSLLLLALAAPSWAQYVIVTGSPPTPPGGTVNAASCSQADVVSAIGAASAGDTVLVPAGNCTWSGFIFNKAVTLQGVSRTSPTITMSGTTTVTLQSGRSGIRRMQFLTSGDAVKFQVNGSWGDGPFVFGEADVYVNTGAASGNNFFRWGTPGGGVLYDLDINCSLDESFFKHKDDQNVSDWNQPSTFGTDDTTGTYNVYVEDSTVTGCTNQGFDFDDSSRSVFRYNTLDASSWNSHGFATSAVGNRHFEIYNNNFGEDESVNQNWQLWIRGGTGLIYDNVITDLNGGTWGDKGEIELSNRSSGDGGGQYPGGCCDTYACIRQIGQDHNGTSQFTNPIKLWGNTGGFAVSLRATWGSCGGALSNFIQQNRDWQFEAGPIGGYTAYVYPHPQRYDQ